MKFEARVLAPEGLPLAKAVASMVVPSEQGPQEVGQGVVAAGGLSIEAQPGPVWALLIDGRPIVAFAVSADEEAADLGEISMLPQGMPWPAFHAADGLVFGVPSALRGAGRGEDSAIGDPTTPPISPRPLPLPENGGTLPRSGLTVGGLVGSAAQQLSAADLPQSTVRVTGATVRLKGIPTLTEDALGLSFPTDQLAATGAGLSEISFTLRPDIGRPPSPPPPSTPPAETGPRVPNLVGYTGDLAARKLAAMGVLSEVNHEIVTDPSQAGRVTRHVPAAGAPAPGGSVVRLFVGKHGGL